MKLKGKHYFDIFWILFFLVILITSLGYHYKARLIPLVVSAPCLIFALYRFGVDLWGKEEEGEALEDMLVHGIKEKVEGIAGDHKPKKEKVDDAEKRRRFFNITLWIAVFLALIYSLGFFIAIPIFVLAYMRIKKESWLLSISSSVGLTVFLYLAFVVGTKSYIYEGYLIPVVRVWLLQQ